MSSNLEFGIEIRAYDQTQSALQSALGGFTGFGQRLSSVFNKTFGALRGGLGFLRDLSLGGGAVIHGIQAITSGLDQLIERGSAMAVTRKSFESLTKSLPQQADHLAQSFVDASNGTLTFRRAMELTNRAIASGINVSRDLPTILDFASKKAISTGTSFDTASEQLITGLARMSAAWLDNFGILNDGMDGVKRAFDALNGKGAFDGLTPAAQKAEFIRQAMKDIREQQSKIGLSGKETAFQYAKLKNHISNAVDGLTEAIAASESFRSAMEGVNNVIEGIKEHFAGRGTLSDLLFGKGQSGGILGIVGGLFEDIGALAAAGFKKAFQSTINEITGTLQAIGTALAPQSPTSQPTSQPSSQPAGGDWGTQWWSNVKRRWWLWKSGAAGMGDGSNGGDRGNAGDGGNGGGAGYGGDGGGQFGTRALSGAKSSDMFPKTWRAVQDFGADFQRARRDKSGKLMPPWLLDRTKDAPLTERGMSDRANERILIDREIKKREVQASRDARVVAAKQVREARKAGYDIDRETVEKDIREKLIKDRTDPLRARRKEIEEEIARTWEWYVRSRVKRAAQPAAAGGGQNGGQAVRDENAQKVVAKMDKIESLLTRVADAGAMIAGELAAGGKRLAGLGGRRA